MFHHFPFQMNLTKQRVVDASKSFQVLRTLKYKYLTSMCTREYLTEFPCDLPFTVGPDGECSVTIEAVLLSRGPSRIIFMVYSTLISIVVLTSNVYDLWMGIRKAQGKGGFHMQAFWSPSRKTRACTAVIAFWTAIMALDPDGS